MVLARFIPLRTFHPFVAGFSEMRFSPILLQCGRGGCGLVMSSVVSGYFFNIPFSGTLQWDCLGLGVNAAVNSAGRFEIEVRRAVFNKSGRFKPEGADANRQPTE